MIDDPPLRSGWVAPDLAEEFPELGLTIADVAASDRHTPRIVKRRLQTLSNRFRGARAITLRQEPVPWAYRVFFRQVGIDPDDQRTPIEQIAVDRLQHGGFESRGLVADALLIATLETGVPVRAFDAARVNGELGLRLTNVDERLAGDGRNVARRQLAIADSEHALAVLFGDAAPSVLPGRGTERVLLTAIVVKGVPALAVEEALWSAAEVLAEGGA